MPEKVFDGWRVTHEVRCDEAGVSITSPARELPAPSDNERCIPVVVPIPVQEFSAGTCQVKIHLGRPDQKMEERSLAFHVLRSPESNQTDALALP